jgi:hypothetical protein
MFSSYGLFCKQDSEWDNDCFYALHSFLQIEGVTPSKHSSPHQNEVDHKLNTTFSNSVNHYEKMLMFALG